MATLHGKEIKKGDKVWSIQEGWTRVTNIKERDTYSIETPKQGYTCTGLWDDEDKHPSLFWQEQTFNLDKPLHDLKVDAKVLVWNNESDEKVKRHFSHFDAKNRLHTFNLNGTSWSSTNTVPWENYEVVEDENE